MCKQGHRGALNNVWISPGLSRPMLFFSILCASAGFIMTQVRDEKTQKVRGENNFAGLQMTSRPVSETA